MLQWYDTRYENGVAVRKRVAKKLADVGDAYPTRRSVLLLAEKILQPINSQTLQPESAMELVEYIDKFYLPSAATRLRPSTLKDYKEIFEQHLRARLGNVRLRDFRTVNGQRILASIPGVSHKRLLRIKAVLSAVFAHAIREGVTDPPNPIHFVSVSGRASNFKGPAYTLTEIETMLVELDGVAKVVVAVAAFVGLRLAELRAIRWGDFDGANLHIRRTAWRTHVGPTKTVESEASVPVVPFLQTMLKEFRGESQDSAYIFAGERRGAPLNLHNLAARVIRPAIERKGVDLTWKGWHAFRRGLASNLYAIGVSPKIIQAVLRHKDIGTTLQFYVTTDDEESRAALRRIEDGIAPELRVRAPKEQEE
jgi:integrase